MIRNTLKELLYAKKYKEIHNMLEEYNPVDLAELLMELDDSELAAIFRMIDKEKAAEVFSYMEDDQRQTLLEGFTSQEISYILDTMYTDDAVDFLEDMPANVVTKLLEHVSGETRADINRLLKYPEDSAGSIMTVEYVELSPEMTVGQALAKIRRVGIESETVYTCYVVERKKLVGIVTAKALMTNAETVQIADLMQDNFISVRTTDDQEDAAKLFRKYGLIAIPVLDLEERLVGIVTFDDAIGVLTDETTEDMHKMAAMTANDDSYLKTGVFRHARNRIGWLLFLMFSATITGTIITRYEAAIAAVPLLVSFIPMLTDTGGNCGSQSSTLVIRGLAVDELHFKDLFTVVWKEFRVSLVVGTVLAAANGIRIYVMHRDLGLAAVIGISLIGTIIVAKMVGCMLPIFAKQLRLDPAIMAAPLITTIVDTCSIIIFFKIATMVFHL
ncbi:magnesium transporter [Extibacter muris]|uniref:magnesium transporter n=1 Tax=Extibacter muris TaxID=1796622 RepID=UPI001D0719B9|nr:magnesium transporter [Extibacter muris]MCB6201731.1 magnesium transporter [Extibacter muris]MCQ4663522.1 magnesium transporter [Extibacter muris]MCQ4693505.1 magnesium transporter [Extibacter muris]